MKIIGHFRAENKKPLDGRNWSTSELYSILRNYIYVRADLDVYDYYECHCIQMITDVSMLTGEYAAQLYGRSKYNPDSTDRSDMKQCQQSYQLAVR